MNNHILLVLLIIQISYSDLWVERKDEEFKDLLTKTEGFLVHDEDIEMMDQGKFI
jgi:hypothetical protein